MLRSKQSINAITNHYDKLKQHKESSNINLEIQNLYGKTIALTRWTFVDKVMSLLFNILFRLVILSFQGVSIFFFKFKFIYFNWRLITLQYCIGFVIHQHASATGIHVVPILNPSTSSFPVPSLCVIPVHQPQASSILNRTWTGDSFLIWYYTCFNVILPNHPTLSLSHRVQKTVLYIRVSFALLHTGLSLPSF